MNDFEYVHLERWITFIKHAHGQLWSVNTSSRLFSLSPVIVFVLSEWERQLTSALLGWEEECREGEKGRREEREGERRGTGGERSKRERREKEGRGGGGWGHRSGVCWVCYIPGRAAQTVCSSVETPAVRSHQPDRAEQSTLTRQPIRGPQVATQPIREPQGKHVWVTHRANTVAELHSSLALRKDKVLHVRMSIPFFSLSSFHLLCPEHSFLSSSGLPSVSFS